VKHESDDAPATGRQRGDASQGRRADTAGFRPAAGAEDQRLSVNRLPAVLR